MSNSLFVFLCSIYNLKKGNKRFLAAEEENNDENSNKMTTTEEKQGGRTCRWNGWRCCVGVWGLPGRDFLLRNSAPRYGPCMKASCSPDPSSPLGWHPWCTRLEHDTKTDVRDLEGASGLLPRWEAPRCLRSAGMGLYPVLRDNT